MNILVTMCNNIIIRKSNESIMVSCLGDSLNEISNAPVNVTPQGGGGADLGDSDRAKYCCQRSPSGAKITCQNPGVQKKYFLPFLFKSSDFALGGGRKCRQKSSPRGIPIRCPRVAHLNQIC